MRSNRDLTLDPEPMVRDAVVLEMPFSPLHSPDCKGLCPICGGDRNLGECPGHDETDPRWSALASLQLPELDDFPTTRRSPTRPIRPPDTSPRHDQEGTTMPVPKRRQSHTRGAKRKAQWKSQPATFSECPQCHQAEAAAPRLRELRVLRRPPGDRGRVGT